MDRSAFEAPYPECNARCCYGSQAFVNMAAVHTVASKSLQHIPDNISVNFLPNHAKLCERILKRGLNYFTQCYIHDIKIFIHDGLKQSEVTCKCWRSLRKNEKPHQLRILVSDKEITEAYCSCKVG